MFESYFEMDRELDRLCEAERFDEVIGLLDNAKGLLPGEDFEKYEFQIRFNRARYRTDCGLYEECFRMLGVLIDEGYACPLHWERFKPLHSLEGFDELKRKNDVLIAREQENSEMKYSVHLPLGYSRDKKYPLFLALHGCGENMDFLSLYLRPDAVLNRGFIFVYVQSSRVCYHSCYSWTQKPMEARRDIRECYEMLLKDYSIDENNVVISGFSGGAITSVDITMAEVIPVKGFVCLSPEVKPKSFNEDNIVAAKRRGVRGVFMEGSLVLPIQDENEMMDCFKKVGLPVDYYINEGIGHAIPGDIEDKLDRALDFILK